MELHLEKKQKKEKIISKKYYTHWNGGRPFKVRFTYFNLKNNTNLTIENLKHIKIYKYDNIGSSTNYEKTGKDKDLYFKKSILTLNKSDIIKYFIGDSPGDGKEFYGNSIVIQLSQNLPINISKLVILQNQPYKYLFICEDIQYFESEFKIISFTSPVGNSDIPYPYAEDANNNCYLLIENVRIEKNINHYDYYDYYYDQVRVIILMLKSTEKKQKNKHLNNSKINIKKYKNIVEFYIGTNIRDTLLYSSNPIYDYNWLTTHLANETYGDQKNNDQKLKLYIKKEVNLNPEDLSDINLITEELTEEKYIKLMEDYAYDNNIKNLNMQQININL
ncbi:MAG: hypothetical protein KIT69_14830 [Propionibacteriaceae bacterium]|nr:hypothetical protein [Propionibacteriaceae bacterium]